MAAGPVEVWLTKRNIAVRCMIVQEDETAETFHTQSTDMRGAQRETTKRLGSKGYAPVNRWHDESGSNAETVRTFRRAAC